MGRDLNEESVIKHKKNAIKKLNNVFEACINNPNKEKYLKRADVLAYWLEDYSSYLLNEKSYDYSKVLHFKRGDVIKVNLGFNVGSEQGGLHFAIVLDKENKKESKVVTVLPLSSGTGNKVHERDVYLGNELYEKLTSKYERIFNSFSIEMLDMKKKYETSSKSEASIIDLDEKIRWLETEIAKLMKYGKEIEKLKQGSIALTEQITTISKMRIYMPKSKNDLLYGIKFSEDAMDKINQKIKELFIFE